MHVMQLCSLPLLLVQLVPMHIDFSINLCSSAEAVLVASRHGGVLSSRC